MDYKNNLYLNNLMTFYELKILLKILLLKLPRVSVSLINLGKELKISLLDDALTKINPQTFNI